MSNPKGGRPPKDEEGAGTMGVRVYSDLGEKLKDLKDLLETNYASILDPFIRDEVEDLWQEKREAIEKMKALDKQKDEVRKQAAQAKPKRKA